MVNQKNIAIGEKNFSESPTWDSNHKFRLPDASGGPGIKLWRISTNSDVNVYKMLTFIVQTIATPQCDQYSTYYAKDTRKLLHKHVLFQD